MLFSNFVLEFGDSCLLSFIYVIYQMENRNENGMAIGGAGIGVLIVLAPFAINQFIIKKKGCKMP